MTKPLREAESNGVRPMTAPEPGVIAWMRQVCYDLSGPEREMMEVDAERLSELLQSLATRCAAAEADVTREKQRYADLANRIIAATGVHVPVCGITPTEAVATLTRDLAAAREALVEIRDKFDCRCALVLDQACPKCIAADFLATPQPE